VLVDVLVCLCVLSVWLYREFGCVYVCGVRVCVYLCSAISVLSMRRPDY